jgi:hypothetical protein
LPFCHLHHGRRSVEIGVCRINKTRSFNDRETYIARPTKQPADTTAATLYARTTTMIVVNVERFRRWLLATATDATLHLC